jgi:hypothetical protein
LELTVLAPAKAELAYELAAAALELAVLAAKNAELA